MAELVVSIDGVETQHVHLLKDRTTLGRRHHNDISLADLSVSGMHCVFERQGRSDIWVTDLESTNGTFINSDRIQRQRLNDQDVLSIGIYRVRFLSEPAAADAGQTSPMKLESLGAPGTPGAMQARFQVLAGARPGLSVQLVKTVTTFGRTGLGIISVSHRRNGYFISLVESGPTPPLLNGRPISVEAGLLSDQDVVELADSRMLFILG